MKDYFSYLPELQAIRAQMKELAQREATILAPLLTDQEDIPLVYEIFTDVMLRHNPDISLDSPIQRAKFVFIALYLFAPCTLLGDKQPHKLRARIAEVTNSHPTYISHTFESVIFQYQRLDSYRSELNYLYLEIEKELIIRGKL